jgi:outer membrane protein OmpA-like peptidoglycan-associated protein
MSRTATVVLALLFTTVSLAFAQKDEPRSKDYPGISRMPRFFIAGYNESAFDGYNFPVTQNGSQTEQRIEGRFIRIDYEREDKGPAVSRLQIVRNLQNAARTTGGQVLDDFTADPGFAAATLRLRKDGKDVWVQIEARTNSYRQIVVERQAMQQDVVMDAAAMGTGLSEAGRVALYGIYFDTASSDLKPESEPTLAEIAKLLKQKPVLKVFIVGHTDMVGDPAANLKLSQARAQSVVNALVGKYGIPGARLSSYGSGPYTCGVQQNRRGSCKEPARRACGVRESVSARPESSAWPPRGSPANSTRGSGRACARPRPRLPPLPRSWS